MIKQVFVADGIVLGETDEEYFARVHQMTREQLFKSMVETYEETLCKVDTMIDFLENTGRE